MAKRKKKAARKKSAAKPKKKPSEREMLLRDIRTLRESIDLDKLELASGRWTTQQRDQILKHIGWCIAELNELKKRL